MKAYIYCADIYCEDCGLAIRQRICAERIKSGLPPFDESNESSFDSDDYPKGPYDNGGGEADCPQHCGNHADCLNAEEIDGHKIGAFLANDLTADGVRYVIDAFIDDTDSQCVQYWIERYDELCFDISANVNGVCVSLSKAKA